MAARRNGLLLSPLHIPLIRRLSTHQAFTHSPYAIIQATELMLDSIHHHTHLPWWMVIVGTTVILRASVTLPLAIYQAKMVAKQELLLPRLKELQGAALHSIVVRCRRANLSHTEANKRYRKEAKTIAGKLFSEEGCSPYKLYLLPWVQIPLWITLSYSLRNMTGFYSAMNSMPYCPGSVESMAAEGSMWFPDLTVVDPYFILPVLMAATNLLNVELHGMNRQQVTRRRRIITNMFRVLSVSMAYIGGQLPSAVVLYWSVSSSSALLQNILLMVPRVRRALNIPKVPSEKPKPFQYLLETMYLKTKAFLEIQRKLKNT